MDNVSPDEFFFPEAGTPEHLCYAESHLWLTAEQDVIGLRTYPLAFCAF
jgi:hypothetical protein